jgi:hypothetical protein
MNTLLVLVLVAGSAIAGCTQEGTPPGTPVTPAPAQPSAAAPAQPQAPTAPTGEFKTADELLSALEQAGQSMETLVAGIKYDRVLTIQGDRQIRLGKLYFVGGKPAESNPERRVGRKFAIVFDTLQLGDERRPNERVYIFDGEMLIEKIGAEKLLMKKRVVPPGQTFDPLKIGEGPMPIPIGQKKDEILRRYDAVLLAPTEGMDPSKTEDTDLKQQMEIVQRVAPGTWQLKLTPKDPKDEFKEIRLWYTRGKGGDLIPRMARTINRAEDVSFVQLINIETQLAGAAPNPKAQIPAEVFDTKLPPGWIEQFDDLTKDAPKENPS